MKLQDVMVVSPRSCVHQLWRAISERYKSKRQF